MSAWKWSLVLALGSLFIIGGVYYLNETPPLTHEVAPTAETQLPPLTPKAAEPEQHYPLPELAPAEQTPLPKLEDSDAMFADALKQLLGTGPVEAFLIPDFLIRRIVITVDNLPRERVPLQFLPVKHPAGAFAVRDDGGKLLPSADNDARYAQLVGILKSAEPARVVQLYLRYYPLFQKAYRELGYTDREFNDRVVAVIDNLLATPEPQGDIELIRPKVFYQFADPALERASAGQKALLRIGAANRAVVKARLGEIRALLVKKSGTP